MLLRAASGRSLEFEMMFTISRIIYFCPSNNESSFSLTFSSYGQTNWVLTSSTIVPWVLERFRIRRHLKPSVSCLHPRKLDNLTVCSCLRRGFAASNKLFQDTESWSGINWTCDLTLSRSGHRLIGRGGGSVKMRGKGRMSWRGKHQPMLRSY